SPQFQRLILLHNIAQVIHSELLELNEKNVRPLPQDIKLMVDYVIYLVFTQGNTNKTWIQQVDIYESYQKLVYNIYIVITIIYKFTLMFLLLIYIIFTIFIIVYVIFIVFFFYFDKS